MARTSFRLWYTEKLRSAVNYVEYVDLIYRLADAEYRADFDVEETGFNIERVWEQPEVRAVPAPTPSALEVRPPKATALEDLLELGWLRHHSTYPHLYECAEGDLTANWRAMAQIYPPLDRDQQRFLKTLVAHSEGRTHPWVRFVPLTRAYATLGWTSAQEQQALPRLVVNPLARQSLIHEGPTRGTYRPTYRGMVWAQQLPNW